MADTLYDIYQRKIFTLAKTIVIKHTMVATIINNRLISEGYFVNENDPTTWKYYLNLAGEYHQSDIDLLSKKYGTSFMTIKVAGNNRPVDAVFEKSLISGPSADLATANEYRYGSQLFNNLITRYPEMKTLILGILNPIDINIAIGARDGEILYCGGYKKEENLAIPGTYHFTTTRDTVFIRENLVESNETSLISELQEWVDAVLGRWFLRDYVGTDNLFLSAIIGILYTFLPKTIMNIREKHVKKNTAHSYHVKQFLYSHGNLGDIVDILEPKQYLWLYRNYQWLESNLGKNHVFKAIVDNIFTPTNLPINGYRLKHNIHRLPIEIRPYSEMDRYPINFNQVGTGSSNRSIRYVLDREKSLAKDNAYNLDEVERTMQSKFDAAGDNIFETKVLESSVIDYSRRSPFPLADVLLNNLIYSAAYGYYRGTVYIDHPTRNERLQLTPLNAVILMIYSFVYGFKGERLTTIPDIMARTIPRHKDGLTTLAEQPFLSLEDLSNSVVKGYVSDEELKDLHGGTYTQPIYTSTNNFYTGTLDIQKEWMRRYYVCARSEDIMGRGYLGKAMSLMYWLYVPCKLSAGNVNYSTWLNTHGIDLSELTRDGFTDFGFKLLAAATGEDTYNTVTMSEKRSAAINILKHFTSYNIQIIGEAIDGETTLLEGTNFRYSNFATSKSTNSKVPLPYATVKQSFSIDSKILLKIFATGDSRFRSKQIAKVKINSDSFQFSKIINQKRHFVNLRGLTILDIRVSDNVYTTTWHTTYPLLPIVSDTVNSKIVDLGIQVQPRELITGNDKLTIRANLDLSLREFHRIDDADRIDIEGNLIAGELREFHIVDDSDELNIQSSEPSIVYNENNEDYPAVGVNMINIEVPDVKARYVITKRKNGEVVEVTNFNNLIIPRTLALLGTKELVSRLQIGSGSAIPTVNDTQMGVRIAGDYAVNHIETVSDLLPEGGITNELTSMKVSTLYRYSATIPTGLMINEITEIGIFTNDGEMFSHALIKDEDELAIVTSKQADEELEVVYEVIFERSAALPVTSLTVNGVVKYVRPYSSTDTKYKGIEGYIGRFDSSEIIKGVFVSHDAERPLLGRNSASLVDDFTKWLPEVAYNSNNTVSASLVLPYFPQDEHIASIAVLTSLGWYGYWFTDSNGNVSNPVNNSILTIPVGSKTELDFGLAFSDGTSFNSIPKTVKGSVEDKVDIVQSLTVNDYDLGTPLVTDMVTYKGVMSEYPEWDESEIAIDTVVDELVYNYSPDTKVIDLLFKHTSKTDAYALHGNGAVLVELHGELKSVYDNFDGNVQVILGSMGVQELPKSMLYINGMLVCPVFHTNGVPETVSFILNDYRINYKVESDLTELYRILSYKGLATDYPEWEGDELGLLSRSSAIDRFTLENNPNDSSKDLTLYITDPNSPYISGTNGCVLMEVHGKLLDALENPELETIQITDPEYGLQDMSKTLLYKSGGLLIPITKDSNGLGKTITLTISGSEYYVFNVKVIIDIVLPDLIFSSLIGKEGHMHGSITGNGPVYPALENEGVFDPETRTYTQLYDFANLPATNDISNINMLTLKAEGIGLYDGGLPVDLELYDLSDTLAFKISEMAPGITLSAIKQAATSALVVYMYPKVVLTIGSKVYTFIFAGDMDLAIKAYDSDNNVVTFVEPNSDYRIEATPLDVEGLSIGDEITLDISASLSLDLIGIENVMLTLTFDGVKYVGTLSMGDYDVY